MAAPASRRRDAEALVANLGIAWRQDVAEPTVVTGRDVSTVVAENRFLAMPPGDPRVLLPLGRPRIAAGALLANQAMRRPRDRIRRRLLAALVRSGLPDRLPRAWLGGPPGAESLVDVLREGWHPGVSAVSLTVRPLRPNHKPTFVAVDADGRALGYGKIATSPGVAERADQEVSGLRWMSGVTIPGLRSPELVADLPWHGCRLVVASPLPEESRPYPVDEQAPDHLLRHAMEGSATVSAGAVASTMLAEVDSARDDMMSARAREWSAWLTSTYGDVALHSGWRHGDWVPWNLAVCGREVWAWDWEHCEAGSAVALDIAHWHLLVHRNRRRIPLDRAVPAAEAAAGRDLTRYGLAEDEARAVLAVARLALVARACQLFATSGLWAEGEREVMIDLLRVTPRGARKSLSAISRRPARASGVEAT